MKFQNESGNKDNFKKKYQKVQSDMEHLIERLPVLNDYFQLHDKIGQGTFSNVYLATLRNSSSTQKYAIKHLKQACEQSRVQSELRCLQEIGGKDNVVPAELCLTDGNDCATIIMPYLPHLRFADYVVDMDVEETRLYMKNLFIALKRVHSFNIIHRDVKPDNFLYNREMKQFFLVDFGLAQVVRTPNQEVTPKSSLSNENLPIDYSKKRKRVSESNSDEDSRSPNKITKRIALKSKDNNAKICISSKVQPVEVKPENEKKVFITQNHKADILKRQRGTKLCLDYISHKSRIFSSANSSVTARKKQADEKVSPSKALSKQNICKMLLRKKNADTDENNSKTLHDVSLSAVASKSSNIGPLLLRNSPVHKKQANVSNSPLDSGTSQRSVPSTSAYDPSCLCSGKGAVCFLCTFRKRMDAPRAGTSGFRAPEVLFRYLYQTTAVDMWASGVVMLCILSSCYPFFQSSSDLASLAEIMTVFGTERTIKVASKFGRRILCSEQRKGVDLKKLCMRLRARSASKSKSNKGKSFSSEPKCRDCFQTIKSDGCLCPSDEPPVTNTPEPTGSGSSFVFPDSAFDLLGRLLDLDPTTRITAEEALNHPFIVGV